MASSGSSNPVETTKLFAAAKNSRYQTRNFASAFLNGDSLDRDTSYRTSLSLPLSNVIFPRSVEDYHESARLTKQMEELYGFHFFTNSFCLNPLVEMDYQAFYVQTNLYPACYASIGAWAFSILLYVQDFIGVISGNELERKLARLKLLFSMVVLIPVPILVACCRSSRFRGYEQRLLCSIIHCFAFVQFMESILPFTSYYQALFVADIDQILTTLSEQSESTKSMFIESTQTIHLSNQTWWKFENISGPGSSLVSQYLKKVTLPITHLNMNFVRPLIVLVIAPMFKLDPYHFILTGFNVNVCFTYLLAFAFPESRSPSHIINKFSLIIALALVTVVLSFRLRQTDRFLRLNFLHAKIVEEKAKAAYAQKQIILHENKSLKDMLEIRSRSARGPANFDSPMTKVISDLRNLQQFASLTTELKENLNGIMNLLTKKSENLSAPDIHEHLNRSRDSDMDRDTKRWAATVLSSISYTRDRRFSASNLDTQDDPEETVKAGPNRYVSVRLHPDISNLGENILSDVAAIIDRDGWNVDVHEIAKKTKNRPISFVTYIAFEQHNLFQLCSVNKTVLINFLGFIDLGYYRNPYHNNIHAADVVSSVEYIIAVLDNGHIQELLNYQEVFAALVAAAIHDFRHPGKSNNFMIKSASEVALTYSDGSVLERMHLAEAFFLLKDPSLNIFRGFTPSAYAEVRKAVIELVLSTDLSLHLQVIGSLKTALVSNDLNDIEQSPIMIMKAVVKCADLGHSAKSVELHAQWSDLIIEEFFLQGDEEHLLGLDISPFMDRSYENSAKNQLGFFEFIVLPFYEVLAEAIFKAEFKTILDQAHQNYRLWKRAEAQQLHSIKDILDKIFVVDGAK